jgi:hypothetical protein
VPLAKDNCCFASVVSRYLQQILDGFIQFEIEPVESGLDLEVLAQPSPAFLELGTVKAFKCRKRVILQLIAMYSFWLYLPSFICLSSGVSAKPDPVATG